MSLETNKALVLRQYEEVINKRNFSVIEQDIHPDYVDHEARPGMPPGPEGVRKWMQLVTEVVPDLQVVVEDMIAEGDKVVVRTVWSGTHRRSMFDLPPTGKAFCVKGMIVWRIADGKLRERWATIDYYGLVQQLKGVGC